MKRGATLLIALLLLVTLILPASAEDQKLLYPAVQSQGDSVYCFAIPLEGGTISVTANGEAVECTSESLKQSGLGITYYCVVGVSSSLSDIQKEQERLALTALSEALGEKDSLVLISMNQDIQFGEKLTDAAARAEAIESFLTFPSFGTNLLGGIDKVLSTITEQETGPCCVVFITDGYNTTGTVEVTEEQAGRIIQNSDLSVSFIGAMMPPFAMYNQEYYSKRMDSYAALSLGGVSRIPLRDALNNYNAAAEEAGREIVELASNWTVLRLDASALPRDQKTVDLAVTWSGADGTITDTIQISTSDLPELPKPTTPPTEPETLPPVTQPTVPLPTQPPVTEPIPEYEEDEAETNLWYYAIGGAAAVVLLVLVLVILAVRRSVSPATKAEKQQPKRGKQHSDALQEKSVPPIRLPEEPEFSISLDLPDEPKEEAIAPITAEQLQFPEDSDPTDDPQAMLESLYAELSLLPDLDVPSSESPVKEIPAEPPREEPAPRRERRRRTARPEPELPPVPTVEPVFPAPVTPGVPTCTVSLIPEGDPDGAVKIILEVNGSCTLGRSRKADVILNETDSALSGLHFELQWDGRVLYITDRGSTNGTSISGIPQRPGHWSRIESGTTIQVGSVRYKVQIQKN